MLILVLSAYSDRLDSIKNCLMYILFFNYYLFEKQLNRFTFNIVYIMYVCDYQILYCKYLYIIIIVFIIDKLCVLKLNML